MTQDRDLEQVLEWWFADGPNEVADRVIDDVFDRVAHMPRRRATRVHRRFHPMNGYMKWMAAAIVLGIVSLVAVDGPFRAEVANPTIQSPSPSPSPSAAASPSILATVPAELQYTWLGRPQPAPAISSVAGSAYAYLDGSTFAFANNHGTVMRASATVLAPGQLTLTSTVADGGCTVGDVGVYDYSLSPGGTKMHVQPISDACAARAAGFVGDWLRGGCKPEFNNTCLGPLEAGTYSSYWMQVKRPCGTCWDAILGALTYTVPAGWANAGDWPASYTLKPLAGYDQFGNDWSDEIDVFAIPAAMLPNDACSATEDLKVGRTASDLVGWLTKHPGLVVSTPKAITIGGYQGQWMDVTVDPSNTKTCPNDPTSSVMLYEAADSYGSSYTWGIGKDRERHIILDLGDGDAVVILVSTRDQADFEAFVAKAMPIIETFTFASMTDLLPSPAPQQSVSASPGG